MQALRRRIEALLADPEIQLPDLALEVATHVHADKHPTFSLPSSPFFSSPGPSPSAPMSPSSASSSSRSAATADNVTDSFSSTLAAVEPTLRKLTSGEDPMGRALRDALLGALCARLLVGPTLPVVADSAAADDAIVAAAAAAVSLDLAKVGFTWSSRAGLIEDVAQLASETMR